MVYSSIPAYLDAANWQQQSNNQNVGNNSISSQLLLPPPPPPSHAQPHVGGSSGSIRPVSMTDRARMANIPVPEGPLKCPRCDSANTKFCYFNNYSLTQPRHFCKTCRRYWTRGGALRNVPVGGGLRRNKRSKASSSKSPATSADRQTSTSSSTSTTMSSMRNTADILGLTPMSFMAPLNPLADFGAGEIGLNYGGINPAHLGVPNDHLNFQLASASLGGDTGIGGIEQWRMQQPQHLPFLGGLDGGLSSGMYSFDSNSEHPGYTGGSGTSQVRPRMSTSGVITQMDSVKMEDNSELNLSRQFLGASGNEQYWNGTAGRNAAWTDLYGFNSSNSTRNPI